MRLTLRTLLAYLDDTLDPAQTRLIGQKVAENPAAQELIARIKDVVRQRRLTVPPATGPEAKVDANTIAEYIDNVLPAEQLAEVEEVCLHSDVHLAEVAACHQILTVVLSEPSPVPPTARDRMYRLVHGREAVPYRKAPARPVENGNAAAPTEESDEALLLGLPLYGRQGSWVRRLAPLLAVGLLAAALVAAIVFGLREASRPGATAVPAASAEAPVARVTEPPPRPAEQPRPAAASAEPGPPPKKEADSPAPPAAPPKKEVREAERRANPQPPAPSPPRVEYVPVGTYVAARNPPSVLLGRRGDGPWQALRDKAEVATHDELVALPGFRSEVRLNGDVGVHLWGDLPLESAVTLARAPGYDAEVVLSRGRVLLVNDKQAGPARLRVRFQKEAWEVTLEERQSQVALQATGRYDPGVGYKDPLGPTETLTLFLVRGPATLKAGYDTYRLRDRAVYSWNNVGAVQRTPATLPQLPDWIKPPPPGAPEAKTLAALRDRLMQSPPDVVLTEAVADRRDTFLRLVGVFSLGAVDDLPHLLDALGDDQHLEVRIAAMNTLRNWMARDAGQDQKLYAVAEKKFSAGQATILMDLLHTYSAEQRADPGTWESLIAYLKNKKLAIRQLADWHLKALLPHVAQGIPAYDVAGGPEERDRAFAEWKKRIPDGKLPPPPPSSGDRTNSPNRGR